MKLNPLSHIVFSQELYSSLVRLGLGFFIALYVWVGMSSGEFAMTQPSYNTFASIFFIISFVILLDIYRTPESKFRRFVTLFFDISCTSYAIILTGDNGFILIYIWLYIAYGTRYGSSYIFSSVILVMFEYNYILFSQNAWSETPLSSSAQIFSLLMIPLYLQSIVKKLRHAKKEAEHATLAKSNFLATMSHEIRTPMSGIIGTARLLKNTTQNIEQKEYTEALLEASNSLDALIDDILDFSKIEANKLELQNSSFELHQNINKVITVLSPNAERQGINLIVHVDPELPSLVIGDSLRIRQILFNLLGNAIKFTEQGEVSLKVFADNPAALTGEKIHLTFDITDTGIGISKSQQDIIFDSFAQSEDLLTRKYGGTGLGTTISKQLVEFMGGKIGVNSELGKGSQFWFSLSLVVDQQCNTKEHYQNILSNKRLAIFATNISGYQSLESYCHYFAMQTQHFEHESELISSLQQSISNSLPFDFIILSDDQNSGTILKLASKINQLDFQTQPPPGIISLSYLSRRAEIQQSAGKLIDAYLTKPITIERLGDTLITQLNPEVIQANMTNTKKPVNVSLNILVAEDEDINAMVLCSFLEEAGHTAQRVINGAQAVAELSQNQYDMVFMDMRMPEMNGLDATLAWRLQETDEQHIPIIALTANATIDDRKACLEAGMDDFLTKPISPEQLSSTIEKFYQH